MHVHGVTIIMTQIVNRNELILRTLITTKFLIYIMQIVKTTATTIKKKTVSTYSWNIDDNLPSPAREQVWIESDGVVTDVVEPPRPIPVHRYHAVFPETEALVWTNNESNIFEAGILRGWIPLAACAHKEKA